MGPSGTPGLEVSVAGLREVGFVGAEPSVHSPATAGWCSERSHQWGPRASQRGD